MTRWALFWLKAPSNYRIAIIIGLSIVLIGQGLGGWIISNATAVGGGNPEAILIMEGEFEAASIYGEAGNMKVTETTVHKDNGTPLYGWKQRDDGVWIKYSLE